MSLKTSWKLNLSVVLFSTACYFFMIVYETLDEMIQGCFSSPNVTSQNNNKGFLTLFWNFFLLMFMTKT